MVTIDFLTHFCTRIGRTIKVGFELEKTLNRYVLSVETERWRLIGGKVEVTQATPPRYYKPNPSLDKGLAKTTAGDW